MTPTQPANPVAHVAWHMLRVDEEQLVDNIKTSQVTVTIYNLWWQSRMNHCQGCLIGGAGTMLLINQGLLIWVDITNQTWQCMAWLFGPVVVYSRATMAGWPAATKTHSPNQRFRLEMFKSLVRVQSLALVGGDWTCFMTFHILGISSSQLTKSYFSEGLVETTNQWLVKFLCWCS